jgi:hypothetical protein
MSDIVHAPIREIRPTPRVYPCVSRSDKTSARLIRPHEKSAASARAHRPIGRVGSERRLLDNTDSVNAPKALGETAFSSGNARFQAL